MSATKMLCEYSDLPVDECAHCTGATLADPLPIRWEGTHREAEFQTVCVQCAHHVQIGSEIVLADTEGDGFSKHWCHRECTRMAGTGKC